MQGVVLSRLEMILNRTEAANTTTNGNCYESGRVSLTDIALLSNPGHELVKLDSSTQILINASEARLELYFLQ